VSSVISPDERFSTTMNGINASTTLGLFGLVVMASLTRSSDRAAAAAGTVSVDERTRTLALAAAVVVPLTVSALWFVATVVRFRHNPPAADGIPFGDLSDSYIYAVLLAQGVVAAVGGPVLGLVLGRWVPRRGATPVAVVLLVLVSILMQGLFASTRSWRELSPFTQFYGPMGIDGDPDRAVVLAGSPYWYVVYLAALCALGVLVALLHDQEAPRAKLLRACGVVGAVAVVALVLTMTGGYDQTQVNPVPSPQG
jgi:hypothetical protein